MEQRIKKKKTTHTPPIIVSVFSIVPAYQYDTIQHLYNIMHKLYT